MSTFIFAPSWINYPNQPKPLKETDEFPTLSRSNQDIINKESKKNDANVWSNPYLIRRIQNDNAEEEETETDEKRYELERLKALVPKTRKSLSASSSTSSNTSNASRKIKSNTRSSNITAKVQFNSHNKSKAPAAANIHDTTINKIPTETMTTTNAVEQKKQHTSEQEQQNFFHFLKSWTSTGIVSTNANSADTSAGSSSSSNSSQSSFFSNSTNDTTFSNDSYFHFNPFPTS